MKILIEVFKIYLPQAHLAHLHLGGGGVVPVNIIMIVVDRFYWRWLILLEAGIGGCGSMLVVVVVLVILVFILTVVMVIKL